MESFRDGGAWGRGHCKVEGWFEWCHEYKRWKIHQTMESFHLCDQHLCKSIGTKESIYIRKEFNSHRIGLEQHHGRRFIVLEHQYGLRDVK